MTYTQKMISKYHQNSLDVKNLLNAVYLYHPAFFKYSLKHKNPKEYADFIVKSYYQNLQISQDFAMKHNLDPVYLRETALLKKALRFCHNDLDLEEKYIRSAVYAAFQILNK